MGRRLDPIWLVLIVTAATTTAQTNVTNGNNGNIGSVPVYTGNSSVGNSPISVSVGNIGIGTTSPQEILDVSGYPAFGGVTQKLSLGGGSLAFNRRVATGYIYDSSMYAYQFQHIGSSNPAADSLTLAVFSPSGTSVTSTALTINGFGSVGIGTSSPAAWDSNYSVIDYRGYGYLYGSSNGAGWTGQSYGQSAWGQNTRYANGISYALGTGGASYLIQSAGQLEFGNAPMASAGNSQTFTSRLDILPNGNVGIGTTTPQAALEINGNLRFTGDGSVQSTAWTGVLCGGDYAESVDVSDDRSKYEPGDVLVADPDHDGKFLKSAAAYSAGVLGVYSTKPGALGRRQTTPKSADEVPMAMIGIVPIKVSAENGAIKPGDLLVTSATPGYAMKGTDRSLLVGAVIGKALGHLDAGKGVIEVGVTLQ